MLLRRVAIENVRSFLDRAELVLDGNISILIGPNGGGKTNLLDSIAIMLRKHLFASMYAALAPTPEQAIRYEFRPNDALNQLVLEKHSAGSALPQFLEVEIEVTKHDLQGMASIKKDAEKIISLAGKKYYNLQYQAASNWDISKISSGDRISYQLVDGSLQFDTTSTVAQDFLLYLQLFEADKLLREEFELSSLSTPMIYLSVNRGVNLLDSRVELSGYNAFEQKRQGDAASSRLQFSQMQLAIGRLAQRYRILQENNNVNAKEAFRKDRNITSLTRAMKKLGYDWELKSIDPLRNSYDIELSKQGSMFPMNRASSGEKELLTYLFTIFALNVRDAVIIVDEPELHLHPKWQSSLLALFAELTETTGNQFVLATHSPTFVSPDSIQYVSRVFSEKQRSRIIRLDATGLPNAKQLFNIVNSENNERIFFADKVVLVEGLSDKIFFEAALRHTGGQPKGAILEIVSVGGKSLFPAYQRLLRACRVKHAVIADLDYVEEVGTEQIKGLFVIDRRAIKHVITDPASRDAATLILAIDSAVATGAWGDAGKLWEYIKSRQRRLRTNLSEEEVGHLAQFIETKRSEQIFLLSRGALEAYLPEGYRSKDINKLVELVSDRAFWQNIPEPGGAELRAILKGARRVPR